MNNKVTILKFGGSVLRGEDDLPRAVHEIYRHWRRGSHVLAVVSAFSGTTDELIDKSKAYGDDPHPEALATLLLTGEATSAALLGLALKRAGVPAKLLTPEQVGILTTGDPLDADPITANIERLRHELAGAVVIVSGFAGINGEGDLTLLGRGGTDFTALFLAQQLRARCVLLKDVDGMYESNRSDVLLKPHRFAIASYKTTIRIAAELVQAKAVRFAEKHGLTFEVAALGATEGTIIGNFADQLTPEHPPRKKPLRVALLGCGTVGGGVYHRLSALPQLFEVVGVVNLDPDKAIASGIKTEQIERDARNLIERNCDIVVELIGGIEPARSLIKRAIELKRHVVTANKALMAEDGRALENLAQEAGVTLHYSASVGGSLPALESITAAAKSGKIRSISGIINGTCNYICDQLAKGVDFNTAVNTAQIEGYAEADPTLDLDGTDAAQKLMLLARASFGVDLPFTAIKRKGIDVLTATDLQKAKSEGRVYRLIAQCRLTPNGIEASVGPVEVPSLDPFALTTGTENCLLIESDSGEVRFLKGRGAGRHATTEAVIADLFDVRNEINISPINNRFKEAHA
jgi:homoserine dehydrogenase